MFSAAFFLYPLIACLSVLVLVPVARAGALRAGFVDAPGGRKDHEAPVPPIGGIVIIPVFIVLSVLFGAGVVQWPFWTALLVMMFAGALDDRFSIRPRWKFVAQFIAALLIVVWGGANVTRLGDLFGFGDFGLGFFSIPFSIVAAVLLINAINLMDGLDGLAGGTVFVALFWMAVLALDGGDAATASSAMLLMGCVAGFLFYNMRHPWRARASVFLGDAGSMALGLALAWYGMRLGHGAAPVVAPMAVAWILALPIMDTCAQFARRVAQGRHPFSPDRNHFHHHFVNAGISVPRTVVIVLAIGFVCGGIGAAGVAMGLADYILSIVWIAGLFTHIAISLRPARFRRFFMRTLRDGDGAS